MNKTDNAAREFDLRGFLASKLFCWHRLTAPEADNLLEVFDATPQPAASVASGGDAVPQWVDDPHATLPVTPPVAQAEPVLFQERTDLRGPYSSFQGWTDWRECSKVQHDRINSDRAFYRKAEARALGVLASTQSSNDADSRDAGRSTPTDAERYQWLVQQQDVTWQTNEGQWTGGGGMDLDHIIDAAIQAKDATP